MAASSLASGIFFEAGGVTRRCAIKQLAAKNGRKAKDLLVLTRLNDPFYIGSQSQYTGAEWAAKLYNLLMPTGLVHLRRLHYFALTQPNHRKPDGRIYTNTTANWKYLIDTCKFARYLGLLDYDAFTDRRNLFVSSGVQAFDQEQVRNNCGVFMIAALEKLFRSHLRFVLSKLLGVHIEIWVEKSTAADLLESIAKKYHVNIVTSMGEISITAVWQFIRRAKACKKPVRIFYVSDYDPAGQNMPVSVARKIEFLLRQHKLKKKLDIKLRPLLLTRRQCTEHKLPGVPIEQKTRTQFAKYHGPNATELHALEVFQSGYISKIIEKQLQKYLDLSKINCATKIAESTINQLLSQARNVFVHNMRETSVFTGMESLFAGSSRWHDYDRSSPWLLDSKRDYMTQLAEYQLHKLR